MDHKPTLGLLLALLGLSVVRENYALTNKRNRLSVTSMILIANKASDVMLLEGDILEPNTRNAMKCSDKQNRCLWQKSADGLVYVPYEIAKTYSRVQVRTIKMAFESFHSETCIRFIPHDEQTAYLDIQSQNGCFSSMGTVGDRQTLSLAAYGCIQHGIIQHELLHALGFYHEHTRSDRDQHIRINWENVSDFASDNFQKQDTNNLDTSYDYSSIMHYDKRAFSVNLARETITPIPDNSVAIGQRKEMSVIDVQRINKLYTC